MAGNETVRSITGLNTTGGAPEETLNLSLDGAAAAATIAVALGTTLTIGTLHFTSVALANWRIQQSNDGVTFFDIFLTSSPASSVGPSNVSMNPGLVVIGGATVLVRCRVATPGGAAAVTAAIRGYTES